ncbi:MAG: DUF2569 family protein [Reyranella sp.]|uniref:DUF2569 family protein n=1 Tax=Reyranella sp. TaxID=1929291 RepID=UPI0025E0238C|nr:DUF2569 family protein [Reyranella sp.]MDP2332155.1 DUF2569 family protein [Reyranella sp.]
MGSFSVWHWVIVLVPIAIVIYAVVRSRRPKAAVATADGGTGTGYVEPRGLGGWLILIVIGQIVGALRVLKAIIDDLDVYNQLPKNLHWVVTFELVLNAAFLAFVVYVTTIMFRELRSFPRLWIAQAVAAILLPLIDAFVVVSATSVPAGPVLTQLGQVIPMAIAAGIWTWYMLVSKRVRNTFIK